MSVQATPTSSYREPWRYPVKRQSHDRLQKCLLLTSTIFVLGFCAIILSLRSIVKDSYSKPCQDCDDKATYKYEGYSSDQCHEVCTTKDCVKTAADMITRMDSGIDPCEDFYSFSCGKYDKISMTDDIQRPQFMTDASEEVSYVIRGILESIPKHIPENIPGYTASKARNLYDSCISYQATEEMAVPTALKHLEYLGIKIWPRLNPDYHFTDPDLDDVIARLPNSYPNPFLKLKILDDDNDNNVKIETTESRIPESTIEVKVTSAGRKLFFTDIYRKEKISLGMREILDYFGMHEDVINSTVEETLAFDDELNNIKKQSQSRIRRCSTNASISCVSYRFDCTGERDFEMERWCSIAVKILNDAGLGEKFSHFNIFLEDRVYFEHVRNLMERTSHRTMAHALALQFLMDNSLMMNYHFRRTAVVEMYSKAHMRILTEDPYTFCPQWVLSHLPTLIGAEFYSTKFKIQLQRHGDEIYQDIRKYLISMASNRTWMEPEAQTELEKMILGVVLGMQYDLKTFSNVSRVDEFYKKLRITDESFLANAVELARFRSITQLFNPTNLSLASLQRNYFQLNPRYNLQNIFVDFASFVYPFISADRPRYSNLGFYGYFLSHEYGHAVEIFFRTPRNMSSSSEDILREKKKCFIDQYSQYDFDHIKKKVNGTRTLNENLADYFGLGAIHQIMKDYEEKHGVEKRLPGLPSNVEQLFFISVAQNLCETNTVATAKIYIDDPHSPNKHRIAGMVKNSDPFSEAFSCPLGSPMNPAEKCAI